jgi:hypothetical protein
MLVILIFSIVAIIVMSTLYSIERLKYKKSIKLLDIARNQHMSTEFRILDNERELNKLEHSFEEFMNTAQIWKEIGQKNLIDFARSFEVCQPAHVYQSIYRPSSDNNSLNMLWICMETGHCIRWRFPSADALRNEADRMIKVADLFEDGKLEDGPMLISIPIHPWSTIH